jgi:hypothetical protein
MVFPNSDYDSSALTQSGDNLVFNHSAYGAEKLRYSLDFGRSWAAWRDWEDSTSIPMSLFTNKTFTWKGDHVVMNCGWFLLAGHRGCADRVRRFQIGRRPRPLPLPLYMLIISTAYPDESPVSTLEESSTGSATMRTSLRS